MADIVGDKQQRNPDGGGGEDLDLLVTVGMIGVGGTRGDGRAHKEDDVVEAVGEGRCV